MPSSFRFPPTVEIKRAIAAAERAGIEIGSIEIQSRRITIHTKQADETPETAYARWKRLNPQPPPKKPETD